MSEPSPAQFVSQAISLRGAGAYKRAVEALRQALAMDPEHFDAHIQLAACQIDLRQPHQALETLSAAARIRPGSDAPARLRALALLQQNRPDSARKSAEEAVRLNPNEAFNHTILGRTLARLTQWRKAEAALRKGVSLTGHSAYPLVNLGVFLINRGRLAEADKVAEDAAAIAPDDIGVLVLRADVALRRGRVEQARDFALWALSLRADEPEAIRVLVSVKANSSFWLGLWWRLNASRLLRVSCLAAAVLAPSFILGLAQEALGLRAVPDSLLFWMFGPFAALVVYISVGQSRFRRMLNAELKQVKLREGF